MLIDFSFKNYRAFKEEQTLSLVASADKSFPENVTELDKIDLRLLNSIVMYGANASGKTTVLNALNFCENLIRTSGKSSPNQRINVKPFLLDEESQKSPAEFQFNFIQNNVRYQYGFIVDRKKVLEEWLFSYPLGRARRIFQREYREDLGESVYRYSSYLKGEKAKLEEVTGPNSLFLSIGATFNNPQLIEVYEWFTKKLFGTKARELNYEMFTELLAIDGYLQKVQELIRQADFGIVDILITETDYDFDRDIPEDTPKSMRNLIDALREVIEDQDFEAKRHKVEMIHGMNEGIQAFPLDDESAGTKQYFTLIFPILEALLEGHVFFVDELDTSLHPLLVRSIVNLFHNKSTNKNGAQLIFNTHDTTLLNLSLFRRDQIWFVEKGLDGSSHIYSLLDFSPRKDEALEKGYLKGRYGAIPFLNESLTEDL